MLKKRLIPVLFLKEGFLVRSETFSYHQNLGNPVSQVERYNAWDVDELIYIDITPGDSYDRRRSDQGMDNPDNILDIIEMVSKKCFMPLTFGGKIKTIEDIQVRLQKGADKVTINSQALETPDFINEAVKHFGSQCIIVSIDVKKEEDGSWQVYSHLGKKACDKDPVEWAVEAQERGAGEIFLNSIDRDGMACGYDIELIDAVAKATNIPIIACGGVGHNSHFSEALTRTSVSAVAAGNIFHFKEMSYILAKRFLHKLAMNVR